MKIIIDNEKTIGKKFVVNNMIPWKEFQGTRILGTKIQVVALDGDYEKIWVKVPVSLENCKTLKKGSAVDFINLTGVAYSRNNYVQVSWTADGVKNVNSKAQPSL